MDPACIDGRTQEYTASGAIILVAVRAGMDFFGFYLDNGDVGALLHAREQTFFNAVASPRIFANKKRENHVLCWEGYGHHFLGL
jgi:hypothetical protein